MEVKTSRREVLLFCSVAVLCFSGGIVNGLIGTGCGIFIMLSSTLIGKFSKSECDRYALAMSSVIPLSIISLMLYKKGSVDTEFVMSMLIPAALGGYIGAVVKSKISVNMLSIIFAAITIYSGVNMILRSN